MVQTIFCNSFIKVNLSGMLKQNSSEDWFLTVMLPNNFASMLKPFFNTMFGISRYYETSAASGEGVDRLFNDMLTGLIERKKLWKAKSANPSIWMMEFRENKRKRDKIDCESRDHGHRERSVFCPSLLQNVENVVTESSIFSVYTLYVFIW